MPLIDELNAQIRADVRLTADAEGLLGGGLITNTVGLSQSDNIHRIRKTVLTFNNLALSMVDAAGVVAYASQKLFDFPAGYMRINSCTLDLTLSRTTTGLIALWDGDISLGLAAADGNATLTGNEVNFLASTPTPQAVAGVTRVAAVNLSAVNLTGAGNAAASDIYLNLLVDDSDHDVTTTPDQVKVNGSIVFLWENLSAN